ncbi:MAG: LptF/LptG family permease, partial [Acidobacteriota bacterium]
YRRVSGHLPTAPGSFGNGGRAGRFPLLPQLIDTYILSSFIFYFLLLLLSFVLMAHVFFFFELLSDIIKNRIPMSRVLTYFFFLTPKLVYDSTPVSVLVAVLVTFGILTKQNEVTAMKACGISLHRLAVPVLLTSGVLSAGLFAFDHYYVPEANRIQDAIRNEIKGRAVQTYLRPDRKWIFGEGSRIYYYRHFDQAENVMVGVSVYELDPRTFRLRRHIWAERARWEWSLKSWIFQNGWTRDIDGVRVSNYRQFQATTFPELDEPPGYFLKEVKQDKQMNFQELDAYIRELRQSGFDTVKLQVQFYKKFSVPLFALIMAALSVPFAFLTGNRGAMAGVGVSFGIAIAYWGVGQLFEQFGNVNQLPPALAAWSPDALFALAGLYLLMRMRT